MVVLADDLHVGTQGVKWALTYFKQPVIYILGNHEYYCRASMKQLEGEFIRFTQSTNVHILIDGVNFIGATLWSDFNVYNKQDIN
ncbi:hypothetical protein [Shewanella sp. 0m-8]